MDAERVADVPPRRELGRHAPDLEAPHVRPLDRIPGPTLISHKVFLKSIGRRQLPHILVNLFFTITDVMNKLTNLCGN